MAPAGSGGGKSCVKSQPMAPTRCQLCGRSRFASCRSGMRRQQLHASMMITPFYAKLLCVGKAREPDGRPIRLLPSSRRGCCSTACVLFAARLRPRGAP